MPSITPVTPALIFALSPTYRLTDFGFTLTLFAFVFFFRLSPVMACTSGLPSPI